ncbi:putative transcription factor C2H2 family [Helianthus annuus]|nr:putative transcription factor C2H2 family [Helianthus annuus]
MGGKSSKEGSYRHSSSFQSGSSSFTGSQYGSSPQQSYSYPPPPHYAAPVQEAYPAYPQHYAAPFPSTVPAPAPAPAPSRPQKKLDRRYSRIADNYSSLEQVTEALARAGLESSNLIVGIDFTKSNEWTGSRSFNRKSLHHIGDNLNPYEQAITIIGKTLAAFDEDNLIPCFGFGDASTHDQDVFSFYSEERFCNGFEEVLSRYREITPHLKLAGPTSFAPVIEQAMTIVEQSGGQYHVLLIIADGQVTRSVDTEPGNLSPQEQRTVDAIVQASKLPLSIVLVGVGDGPWDMMREFDDNIPARDFDNFQFVNFTEIMSKNVPPMRKETEFALAALMEIPTQYKATIELNILGGRKGISPNRVALPPPIHSASSYSSSKPSHSSSFQKGSQFNYGQTSPVSSAGSYYDQMSSQSAAPPASNSTYDNQVCPICLTNQKDMAFGCGHQTCCECGQTLQLCPICRKSIETRIKLY